MHRPFICGLAACAALVIATAAARAHPHIWVTVKSELVYASFAEKDPVKLVGAPTHCKLSVGRPQEMNAALTRQLSQLAADQRDPSLTIGAEYANKIFVKCP